MSESPGRYDTGRPRFDWDEHTAALEALAAKFTGQLSLTSPSPRTSMFDISYLVYDIEIVRAIPDKNQPTRAGIEYCSGWQDYSNMGISVIGAYDSLTDRFRGFCDDNLAEFQQLLELRSQLVTFNGIGFDDKILTANGFEVPEGKSTDLLREIWKAAGLGPEYQYPTHSGYGLDAVCKANGLLGKTGNSALAPIDWQKGKIGQVIDGCLQDVKITRDLYRLIMGGAVIIDPVTHEELKINLFTSTPPASAGGL